MNRAPRQQGQNDLPGTLTSAQGGDQAGHTMGEATTQLQDALSKPQARDRDDCARFDNKNAVNENNRLCNNMRSKEAQIRVMYRCRENRRDLPRRRGKGKVPRAAGSLVFDLTGLVYSENLGDFISAKVRECKILTRDHPMQRFLSTCP